MKTIQFLGLECIEIKNDFLSLLVTKSVGPRLISLRFKGGDNIFAELPETTLECPGNGILKLWGGHRLWHAPEDSRRTYIPDDQPVLITEIPAGLQVIQPVEPQTGIVKSLSITLVDDSPQVIVDHTLENHGLWPIRLAPWSITQLKPGGYAILPQPAAYSDEFGLLPNRQIALWPYTDISSPHIILGNNYLFVHATMREGALKLGYPNPTGWIGYILDRTLFVKYAEYKAGGEYFDGGSSSECYCNPDFLELETLGPGTSLEPGEKVAHRETWKIFEVADFLPTEEYVTGMVGRLAL